MSAREAGLARASLGSASNDDTARSAFTPDDAHELLATKFAPWVRELGLVVESCSLAGAVLRLPPSTRIARFGDTVCGQALLACADSAIAIAICAAFGEFRNVTTVSQSMTFMRAIPEGDVRVDAVVSKLGRSLVFAEASFRAAGDDRLCAHAVATWALVPDEATRRLAVR